MPKNQVNDPITDREVAFAHLILSGTMTDRQAAEAAGLNPHTAAHTKSKPCVRAYMLEHRAAMHEQRVQQETEELRRMNQGRERVLARLWQIADLDPDMTRNSMSAQIKALSMIVAIEGLIPDRHSAGRPGSAQNKPAAPSIPPRGAATDSPSGPGPTSGHGFDPSGFHSSHPFTPSETTPSAPHASVTGSVPNNNRVPSSIEKKPDTWRLRL